MQSDPDLNERISNHPRYQELMAALIAKAVTDQDGHVINKGEIKAWLIELLNEDD
jgi:hypothetical protein